uniref:Glutaredoxin domain-containing protein n=1 Tax=Eucampia antarctica TaxID=49252 RepID=A0A6U0TD43_9STRA|mmetsp:Transcript_7663/g.7216  ORF Transcript_7663/g.7216 Transcript_7663/m.7216 type:complete len:123 (+) Transcript_7663:95-463(+)
MTEKIFIVLVSKGVSDRTQREHQRRASLILESKNIPYVTVDGMDPEQRVRRNKLFEISGRRGQYPQFFFQLPDETITFLGGFETLEILNDTTTMSEEQTSQCYPELQTWEQTFGDVVPAFSS